MGFPAKKGTRDLEHTILVNGKPLTTTTRRTAAKFVANASASIVLWPAKTKDGRNPNIQVNGRVVDPTHRFEHPGFGADDNCAFATNQAIKPTPARVAPILVPPINVNGATSK